MRTTVNLDQDVYEAVLGMAQTTQKSLGKVLSTLVRDALRRPLAHQPHTQTGFPVFSVDSDAGVIPVNRAAELLYAEDEEEHEPI